MEGTVPINLRNMEGTPPLTGRALPNLINAVSMLKSKPLTDATTTIPTRPHHRRPPALQPDGYCLIGLYDHVLLSLLYVYVPAFLPLFW